MILLQICATMVLGYIGIGAIVTLYNGRNDHTDKNSPIIILLNRLIGIYLYTSIIVIFISLILYVVWGVTQ
jgi:hypothetical protein